MIRTLSTASRRFELCFATCLVAVMAAMVSTAALAQPATEPLLTRAPAVRPNLLFVLDDSGSMDDSNSNKVYARHYELATGSCGSSTYANQSPVNNLLFYDPAKRYEPGFDNNGVQLANPTVPSSWTDFQVYLPKTGQNITSLTTKSDICQSNRYDKVEIRGSSFRLNDSGSGVPNPFASSSRRTDCASSVCTLAEEKQNITNWRTYHVKRLQAAKVGVAKAFSTQPDTFRLGYTTIHVSAADGSGSGSSKLTTVKDYALAKTDFYTWLNGITTQSWTPLRKALDVAGQYFSRSDKNGPWAHKPWQANSDGEAIADHLSCRRNFTIMVTDGEWNSDGSLTDATKANVDGTIGPEIVHSGGVFKYQYKPGDTSDLRNIGKADKTPNSASDYANTLADVALYYWSRDLRTDLLNNVSPGKATDKPFWQNMVTYTAAFGPVGKLTAAQLDLARAGQINWTSTQPAADLPETIDDLIHAAHNGGGEFLMLTDAADFANELGRVVDSISGEQFSQAGVAASAVTLTAGTKKFVPYYTAGRWWGNVKMINLSAIAETLGDETGVAWSVIPTDTQNKPTGPAKIAPPDTRAIYTWTPSTKGIAFNTALLSLSSPSVVNTTTSTTPTLLNKFITADIIQFLRGEQKNEGDLPLPFRKREAILGDIVNSTPVFIKNNSNFKYELLPSGTPGFDTYGAYMTSKAITARPEGVLFIGANDGMVHGFREGTASVAGGSETFAYIPQGVFSNLHMLADRNYSSNHRFFVDGPLSESDAYISAPDLSSTSGNVVRWANLVLGSTGAGGRSVFALDVTKPLNMSARSVLWEANNMATGMADLGYVMSTIETGITVSGDWVAIVGNGPYGSSGRAHLFILNLSNGTVLKKMDTDSSTGNGLGGVRLVRNEKSQIVGAYAGDLKGNVWRFDLSAGLNTGWPNIGQLLYTAKDGNNVAQPITAAPGVVPRPDALGGYMVIVGTGKLYDLDDQSSTQTQAAYGLWDKAPFGGTVTFSGITSMSNLISVNVALDTTVSSTATSDTNPDGVTRYYQTTVSRTPNWTAGDRGWFINYSLTTGQRTIFNVEPTKKVVRIDTIAPRSAQVSCSAGTTQGFNYLVSPLTGTCRTAATFDTNNDNVFDTNDSTACVYSTEADGEDVVLDILKEDGSSSEFVDIQDSRGHIKARVDDTPPPIPATIPGVTRSWRQLFMRPN